jgi:hypothetical protein
LVEKGILVTFPKELFGESDQDVYSTVEKESNETKFVEIACKIKFLG